VLESPFISEQVKEELNEEYATLNPVALKRKISRMQDRLSELSRSKTVVCNEKQRANLEYILR